MEFVEQVQEMQEEIVEKAQEIMEVNKDKSGKTALVLAGVGIGMIAGHLTSKYVLKPLSAKIKAHKLEKARLLVAEEAATVAEAEDTVEDSDNNIEE